MDESTMADQATDRTRARLRAYLDGLGIPAHEAAALTAQALAQGGPALPAALECLDQLLERRLPAETPTPRADRASMAPEQLERRPAGFFAARLLPGAGLLQRGSQA